MHVQPSLQDPSGHLWRPQARALSVPVMECQLHASEFGKADFFPASVLTLSPAWMVLFSLLPLMTLPILLAVTNSLLVCPAPALFEGPHLSMWDLSMTLLLPIPSGS